MKNYSKLLAVFLLSVFSFVDCTTAQPKKLRFEPYQVEFAEKEFSVLTITGPKAQELTPFEVENPHRLVLDLPRKIKKFLKESVYTLKDSSCSQSIRIGSHPTKTRVVIDLHTACDFSVNKKSDSLEIKLFSSATPPQATPSVLPTTVPTIMPTVVVPTALPTLLPSPTTTPEVTLEATISPTVVPSITPTETPIPTETEEPEDTETPTPAPTIEASPTPTITPVNTISTITGKALHSLEFYHDTSVNQIKLNFSQRVSFKTIKEDTRKYKISVVDCSVTNQGLTLPQFPPNDLIGFTLVRVAKTATGLEIIINVEDGIKISAANIENTIVVSAIPAGF